MNNILKSLITITIIFSSSMAHAGFGWFVLGAMMGGSSSSNSYQQAYASPVYITMKESNYCLSYTNKNDSEKINKIAIALNLIQTISEFKSDMGKNCLHIRTSSAEGNVYHRVLGTLEDFQTTVANIKQKNKNKSN